MSYDENNIFAKILRAEIPCAKVYEDGQTLAFMDIMPQAPGHTLVIPKEPAETLLDLSSEAASDLINKVQVVAKAVQKAMNAEGITIFQLNGASAGQTVPHIHFHVLPGSLFGTKKHASTMSDPTELAEIAARIARELD